MKYTLMMMLLLCSLALPSVAQEPASCAGRRHGIHIWRISSERPTTIHWVVNPSNQI